MSTQSIWSRQRAERPSFSVFSEPITVDVAIIGGGITGMTAAYHLLKAGKRIALLEQAHIGEGDTGSSTAFLTYVVDTSLKELVKTFGKEAATLVWQSNREMIDQVERIVYIEQIDCGFKRCPAKIFAHNADAAQDLKEEAELAQSLGFPVIWHDEPLLPFAHHGYMEVPDQAKFNPLQYIEALALDLEEEGALIFEKTHVHEVEGEGPIILHASEGTITATDVIVATHGPVTQSLQFPSRFEASRTYVIEADLLSDLAEGIYWNTEEPYHYFRVDRDHGKARILLGGEDHVTGKSDIPEMKHFERLESYLTHLLPTETRTVFTQWSGQIYETIDGLPYIGRAAGAKHFYVATGFAGNGMTFGSMAGHILSHLIVEGAHPWADLYKTIRMHGAGTMIELGASFVSELIHGKVKGDVSSIDDILPGTGAILIEAGKPLAVFKKTDGGLIRLSGVCTHLHCTVKWNGAEKSWDCPCHGSRFDLEGGVLNGPAIEPLDQIK